MDDQRPVPGQHRSTAVPSSPPGLSPDDSGRVGRPPTGWSEQLAEQTALLRRISQQLDQLLAQQPHAPAPRSAPNPPPPAPPVGQVPPPGQTAPAGRFPSPNQGLPNGAPSNPPRAGVPLTSAPSSTPPPAHRPGVAGAIGGLPPSGARPAPDHPVHGVPHPTRSAGSAAVAPRGGR